jgi:hypothetical protein
MTKKEKSSDPAHAESQNPAAVQAPEDRVQQIALRAYYRAEARGFAEGGELDDWFEAEKEIDAT